MDPIFANGLFDSPWLALIFLIIGLISNLLMKRKQPQPEEDADSATPPSPPPPGQKQGEFDLEELLRRWAGEERPTAPPPPPPPVIRREQLEPPIFAETVLDESQPLPPPISRPSAAILAPPVSPAILASVQAAQDYEAAAREIVRTAEAVRGTSAVAPLRRGPRQPRASMVVRLRQPQQARQAFIASLVFGPPKGFET